MKIRFTSAPTFTKGIIAAAVLGIIYLATTSNLPSCSSVTVLTSGGECIERQSFLHTASGWLALICVAAALVLLALKHKDAILGRTQSPANQPHQPHQPHQAQGPASAPVPGRTPDFCAKCGTRIIAGDRFCQGCGALMDPQSRSR